MKTYSQTQMCLLSFILAFGLSACSNPTPSAQATERPKDGVMLAPGNDHLNFIKVESVEPTDAAPAVRLTGKIGFDENHTQRVASPIDGRATKILVELGQKVHPGQALVELTSPQVSSLQAEAQKSLQDMDIASKGLERAQKLKLDGAISEKEAAQAEADYHKAKSDTARAQAQLKSLGVSPSDPTVSAALSAQIGGTIVERNTLVGQEVRADSAQPLFTISNLDVVWVLVDVYEQDLGLVQQGANVKLHVPAYPGETFDGKVEHIGDVVDPNSRTVKLRCTVPNPAAKLKPEMFATVELAEAAGKKVVMLPSSAILTDSESTQVIVAGDDHVYRKRVVTVGPERDGRVRILDGLKQGEKVVTLGAIFLKRDIESD